MIPIIEGDNILELIPQRPPIVMVDKFFGIQNECSYSGLRVMAENIFVEDSQFKEPGIIEHIAQSAAARVGYICKQTNQNVPIGFIGSVDKMTISNLPKVGDDLYTEIKVIQEIDNITLIAATVKVNEMPIADCRMKIFLNK